MISDLLKTAWHYHTTTNLSPLYFHVMGRPYSRERYNLLYGHVTKTWTPKPHQIQLANNQRKTWMTPSLKECISKVRGALCYT